MLEFAGVKLLAINGYRLNIHVSHFEPIILEVRRRHFESEEARLSRLSKLTDSLTEP